MTKVYSTKRSLFTSVIALMLCFSMLLGTTFAWFTDSVTSAGNKIQAGTLKVDLELLDKETGWASIKESKAPIFNYDKWEPGYVDVKVLKIENEGSLALKWLARFVLGTDTAGVAQSLSALANVIDVYVLPSATELTYPADRDLTGYTKVGTVAEFVNTIEDTTNGTLEADQKAYLGIALKMQESAGNEYQNMTIAPFDIQIIATQLDAEMDSFDDQYDVDAPLDFFPVSSAQELNTAIVNGETNISLTNDITTFEPIIIDDSITINGNGYKITRTEEATVFGMRAAAPQVYTGQMITVKAGQTLTLENIIVDGGAIWTGEVNSTLQRGTVNEGIIATGALVVTEANATIELGKGAVLQNNAGANAVNLGTRTGGKLVVNGGEIINNYSSAGAIWGGGEIILNSGKISYNHGGIGGAIRAVTNIGTLLTMNGGEMNHNYSDGNGGAIWAGTSKSNNVYVLNGGEMAYNYSATTGGAIYAGYYETVKIGGTFKMHDNDCASDIGSAIRFHDHASFYMTGGEIYNHDDDALFLYNNSTSITGGRIEGDFGYSGGLGLTWGTAVVDGVINYNLATNHNTAYLAAEFGALKFTVNESADNFAQFNFKPAAGYVYTEGDEAKLVCMNAGYKTYWDAATATFRLQAK